MTDPATIPLFDGHNDVLLRLYRKGGVAAAALFAEPDQGAINLPAARAGGFCGGYFAVYVPSSLDKAARDAEMTASSYDLPLPPQIGFAEATPVVMAQIATLLELERLGYLRICKTAADIRATIDAGGMAAILHMEGAEGIDPDLATLDVLYASGLRSLGPVWSRPTAFGHGVPFRFPSDGDIGPGLTDHGKRLVKRCNALGIAIDLSHMNAAGFWDVARISEQPLIATHSNAHAICASSRNLTDDQLKAVRDSDGMVGLNFAVAFLREDGRKVAETPIDQMLRHLDHLIEVVGEDRVGFGSDYDGAIVPEALTSCAALPRLQDAMTRHGFDAPLMAKLCHANWLRVLEKTWGS